MVSKSTHSPAIYDSLSAWSRLFTYLFIGLFLFALVQWCGKLAYDHRLPLQADGSLNRAFHWWLRVPTAFLVMVGAIVATRCVLRLANIAHPYVRLFRWFHPGLAMRDIFLLCLAFGLSYFGVTFAAAQYLHISGAVFDAKWYMTIGLAMAILTALAILLLDSVKWITQGAIAPHGKMRFASLALYGVTTAILWPIFANMLLPVFKDGFYSSLLVYSTATLIAALVLLLGAQLALYVIGANEAAVRFPIQARLGIVGPPEIGKTVLFMQVYRELVGNAVLGVRIRARDTEGTNILKLHAKNAEKGMLPPPSLYSSVLDFELVQGADPIANYAWLDMPGEVFNQWTMPDSEYLEYREEFKRKLLGMNGLMVAISAFGDHVDRKGEHLQAYFDSIDEYLIGQIRPGQKEVSAQIAVVVTQWKRQGAKKFAANQQAHEIKEYAKGSAKRLGITKFRVKIFRVDSIANASAANNNKPVGGKSVISWRVAAPVLWLAASACRTKMGAREMAKATFFGGAMHVVEVIGVLEQLERDAR